MFFYKVLLSLSGFNYFTMNITLDSVKSVLLSMGYVSDEQIQKLSDEQVMLLDFKKDLGMDSLDCLILLQNLEGKHELSLINVQMYDCCTIKDLLDASSE